MKRYLITGGAGFIGCNYVRFLLSGYPDAKVTVYDKLTYSGRVENLEEPLARFKDRCELVVGDICDSTAVERAVQATQPDIVVNFAAETHVDRSIADPDTFVRTDVNGTAVLLRQVCDQGVARYHQVSTDEVYGTVPVSQRSSEGDVLNPSSPYSASKAAGDLMAMAWHQTYGLPVTVSRGANCVRSMGTANSGGTSSMFLTTAQAYRRFWNTGSRARSTTLEQARRSRTWRWCASCLRPWTSPVP